MKKKAIFFDSEAERDKAIQDWMTKNGYSELFNPDKITDKFTPIAGKKGSLHAKRFNDTDSICLKSHETGATQSFGLAYKKGIKREDNPAQYPLATKNHPYFKVKKVDPAGLNIREKDGVLYIPLLAIGSVVSLLSYQKINAKGDKRFMRGGLGKTGYHFPIGEQNTNEIVYVCEGIATALSIYKITGQKVYCAFSKTNLDSVCGYALTKHKKVILALDNDGPKTHKTTIKNKKNLIVLCPEKIGDFNDHQHSDLEIYKLQNPSIKVSSLKHLKIVLNPREWLFGEKIFIKGAFNQFTGEAGIGKSSVTRELAYRYATDKETPKPSIIFAQEDNLEEDITPFFNKKGIKEGDTVPNLEVVTDWGSAKCIISKIKTLGYLKDLLIIIDPVHSLFADLKNPTACRETLKKLQKACPPGATVILVNHPKRGYKDKTASEVNSSTKVIGEFCRATLFMSHNKETNEYVIHHTKKQLSPASYTFKITLEYIKNKAGKLCSLSWIEDFQCKADIESIKKATEGQGFALDPTNPVSEKRQKVLNEILTCIKACPNEWVTKKTIMDGVLKNPEIKYWEVDKGIMFLVGDKQIERQSEGLKRLYKISSK